LSLFKRNRKDHWENVYQKLSPAEVGWYQAYPEKSLKLINNTCADTRCRIIDVGGGTSMLSKHLLDQGYRKLTVLDISEISIEKAKSQLGADSNRVKWIEADITNYSVGEQYDVWHDRAVFHFLTKIEDRKRYIHSLNQALKLNGHLIMATFSPDAPPKCSGLNVVRYSPETLQNELGDNFGLVESFTEIHVTPSGVPQNFIFCRFVKHA
jgi:2-polyprenyl-3-methyl-5-hydroxy-6-metoxy-1,4-benzoquinol methylase